MKQIFLYSPPLLVLQTPVSGLTYDLPTNINNLQACLKFHKNTELYTSYPFATDTTSSYSGLIQNILSEIAANTFQ